MVASHGDGFPEGDVHGGGFQAIQEYFQRRSCRQCSRPYSAEGIELLRQEPGVLVVKVGCSDCGHPLGIALVGMSSANSAPCKHPKANAEVKHHPTDWSRKDIQRLSGKPSITYDDVLNAHEFLDQVGKAWSRFLPKTSKKIAPSV